MLSSALLLILIYSCNSGNSQYFIRTFLKPNYVQFLVPVHQLLFLTVGMIGVSLLFGSAMERMIATIGPTRRTAIP